MFCKNTVSTYRMWLFIILYGLSWREADGSLGACIASSKLDSFEDQVPSQPSTKILLLQILLMWNHIKYLYKNIIDFDQFKMRINYVLHNIKLIIYSSVVLR